MNTPISGVKTLIVRGLQRNIQHQTVLYRIFSKYGTILDIQVPRGIGGNIEGYALVKFKSNTSAEKAYRMEWENLPRSHRLSSQATIELLKDDR